MSWDDYAEHYRQVDHLTDVVPPVLREALAAADGDFLDVGCGEGFLLDRVTREFPSWTITGFEISRARADMAGARGHHVLVDEDGVVPVAPESLDVVACCHVIEHVDDDFEYARYLASLVRPGGHLYIETPVKLAGAWYFRRNPRAGWVLDPTHVREYRSEEAVNEPLTAAGLVVVNSELTQIQLSLASAEALVRRVLRRRPSTKSQLVGWRSKHLALPRYRIQSVLVRKPV
jgi:2-polyprenyl-3-methyl-5-hydroxy-6-metoxy-1,4-benzoquinol methylase